MVGEGRGGHDRPKGGWRLRAGRLTKETQERRQCPRGVALIKSGINIIRITFCIIVLRMILLLNFR